MEMLEAVGHGAYYRFFSLYPSVASVCYNPLVQSVYAPAQVKPGGFNKVYYLIGKGLTQSFGENHFASIVKHKCAAVRYYGALEFVFLHYWVYS